MKAHQNNKYQRWIFFSFSFSSDNRGENTTRNLRGFFGRFTFNTRAEIRKKGQWKWWTEGLSKCKAMIIIYSLWFLWFWSKMLDNSHQCHPKAIYTWQFLRSLICRTFSKLNHESHFFLQKTIFRFKVALQDPIFLAWNFFFKKIALARPR